MNRSTTPQFTLLDREPFRLAVEILLICSVMVLGVCGNTLVLIAVWKEKIIKNNTECICGELSSGRFPALHNDSPIDCSDIHKGQVDSWHVCLQARGDSVCNYFECNPSYLDNYKY